LEPRITGKINTKKILRTHTIPRIQIGHYEEFPLSKGTTSTFFQKGQFGSSLEGNLRGQIKRGIEMTHITSG